MFGTIEERRYGRNWRLLNRDFPWLWAIKSEWKLDKSEIRVQKADEWMHILDPLLKKGTIPPNAEIWFHCERLYTEMVKRIECDPESQASLAYRILEACKGFAPDLLYFVIHLVVVDRVDDREIIEIYRPPKRHFSSFNDLLRRFADKAVIDKYHALVVK